MIIKQNDKKNIKMPKKDIVTAEIHSASGSLTPRVQNKIKVLDNLRQSTMIAISENKPTPIFNNLMPIVYSMEVLQLAYGNIKSNKGSLTKGTTPNTAESFSIDRLKELQQELKTGTYKFPKVRRIWVPKPKKINWSDKNNLIKHGRPLGMPDFESKVVQEAMRIVLNSIYEPIFNSLNVSHGFRPKKGCHNAIIDIPTKAQGMRYALEGDIKGAFDNLKHDILINILSRRITDKVFLNYILKLCRAGIFDELQQANLDSLIGVPQGGIISPLLWNIYMHEFDKYIHTELAFTINAINKRQQRKQGAENRHYKRLVYQLSKKKGDYAHYTKDFTIKLKDLPLKSRAAAITALKETKEIKKKMLNTPSKNANKQPIRYLYIRYADDWILLTNSSYKITQYLKNKIASYLKYYLGLTLSLEKTKVTDLNRDKARFLGFTIYFKTNKKLTYTAKGALKRVTGQKPIIGIDMARVIPRLQWRAFLTKGKPREQPSWTTLSDYEIISKYNSIIRGLVMYYTPIIRYRSTINYLIYIFEYSCYKTLCHKHRTTIKKLLKTHSFPITALIDEENTKSKKVELITVKTYWPRLKDTSVSITKALNTETDPEVIASQDFLNNAKTYWRTKFKLTGRCCICGSNESVEMHHIKHVRKFSDKAKNGFEKIMSLLNRKQIPVCKYHHQLIHNGKYDDLSLTDLYDIRVATSENYLTLSK